MLRALAEGAVRVGGGDRGMGVGERFVQKRTRFEFQIYRKILHIFVKVEGVHKNIDSAVAVCVSSTTLSYQQSRLFHLTTHECIHLALRWRMAHAAYCDVL